jgi:hypothetical protein
LKKIDLLRSKSKLPMDNALAQNREPDVEKSILLGLSALLTMNLSPEQISNSLERALSNLDSENPRGLPKKRDAIPVIEI